MPEAVFSPKELTIIGSTAFSIFDSSEWKKVFGYCGESAYLQNHDRFLRSLSFGDDDAEGHCIDGVRFLVEKNPSELVSFLKTHESFCRHLEKNNRDVWKRLFPESYVRVTQPENVSDTVRSALKEAESAIQSGKPEIGVDRAFTALHGTVAELCRINNIPYAPGDDIQPLIAKLRVYYETKGDASKYISTIIASISKITHNLEELRNKHSLAHPNENLIEIDEAHLVVNLSNSLVDYFLRKINGTSAERTI